MKLLTRWSSLEEGKIIIQAEKKSERFQRIVSVALDEFGSKQYEVASINQICKQGEIAKGSIYHYFKDKDALYLYCVKASFAALIEVLNQNEKKGEKGIQEYFVSRQAFFNESPEYAFIFTHALLNPPVHLTKEIDEIKQEWDTFNLAYYKKALETMELKEGLTKEEAMEYFLIFQESFHYYFQQKNESDPHDLMRAHEMQLRKLLNIIFYGMILEEENA